jgi:hypothetical protein
MADPSQPVTDCNNKNFEYEKDTLTPESKVPVKQAQATTFGRSNSTFVPKKFSEASMSKWWGTKKDTAGTGLVPIPQKPTTEQELDMARWLLGVRVGADQMEIQRGYVSLVNVGLDDTHLADANYARDILLNEARDGKTKLLSPSVFSKAGSSCECGGIYLKDEKGEMVCESCGLVQDLGKASHFKFPWQKGKKGESGYDQLLVPSGRTLAPKKENINIVERIGNHFPVFPRETPVWDALQRALLRRKMSYYKMRPKDCPKDIKNASKSILGFAADGVVTATSVPFWPWSLTGRQPERYSNWLKIWIIRYPFFFDRPDPFVYLLSLLVGTSKPKEDLDFFDVQGGFKLYKKMHILWNRAADTKSQERKEVFRKMATNAGFQNHQINAFFDLMGHAPVVSLTGGK